MAADSFSLSAEASGAMAFPKRRRGLSADAAFIDFSPLVDMTFQLLAFFIMTVRLANQEMVDVPEIRRGVGVDKAEATVLEIRAPTEAYPESMILLVKDGRTTELKLDDVEAALEADGKEMVVIKAERLVRHGVVRAVSSIVASCGKELYVGVKDKD